MGVLNQSSKTKDRAKEKPLAKVKENVGLGELDRRAAGVIARLSLRLPSEWQ